MSKLFLIILLTVLFTVSCNKQENEVQQKVSGPALHKLVIDALWGSEKANNNLSGMVNSNSPINAAYHRLSIDSIITKLGKKFYFVLIEYPNPLYNLLSVYDEYLNLYLRDNSLNGNIVTKWQTISAKQYLVASENFITKDFLKLSRLSLYKYIDGKFYLVFRSFNRFANTNNIYDQEIKSITDTSIVTRITSKSRAKINNNTDTFIYNSNERRYISNKNIFSNFVLNEISNASWKIEKPELTIESFKNEGADSISKDQNKKENDKAEMNRFQLSLNSDWNVAVRISITEHLKSKLDGDRYINEKLGSQITVIPLPKGSNGTQFVKYNFGQFTKDNYHIRSTKMIEAGNNFVQFFEHSCGDNSFILILEVPKYTYGNNKKLYNDIISSFSIDC